MSTISVIIPTWNRSETLIRAVTSVLNQTYPVKEIFVCDDGSTDNSEQLILALNNEKIKWLKGNHAGMPSIPRNRGIAASTGEWLAFLDSDDEWLPKKIEQQIQTAEKLKTDAVCCNAFHINAKGLSNKPYLDYTKDIVTFSDLLKTNYIICSTSLIKRALIPVVIGFPETKEMKAIEDYALWLRVATQTNFAFVNAPLANYFDFATQSIRSNVMEVWNQRVRAFSDFMNWEENNELGKSEYYQYAEAEYRKALQSKNNGNFINTIKQFFSSETK